MEGTENNIGSSDKSRNMALSLFCGEKRLYGRAFRDTTHRYDTRSSKAHTF